MLLSDYFSPLPLVPFHLDCSSRTTVVRLNWTLCPSPEQSLWPLFLVSNMYVNVASDEWNLYTYKNGIAVKGNFDRILITMKNHNETDTSTHFNIKMPSYKYRNYHYKDKTLARPSCLYNGTHNTLKDGLYVETGPWIFYSYNHFQF